MPQPYRHTGGGLWGHPTALLERPELAAMIGLIAAHWEAVELRLASIFAYLLGGDETAALDIFAGLIDRNLRKQAFLAVARDRLPPDLTAEIVKAFEDARRLSGARNDVVHGLWSVVDSRPDSLMLGNRADKLRQLHGFSRAIEAGTTGEFLDSRTWDFLEYKLRDFKDVVDRIEAFQSRLAPLSTRVLVHVREDALRRHPR